MDSSWKDLSDVESIVSSITGDVNTFVGGLWSLWLELGYKEDICMERLQTARHHLSDLMHEMKTEEEGAVEKLRLVSKLLSEECQDLSEELQISFTKPSEKKLLAYHEAIKMQRDELRSERSRRLKEYDILRNEERRLCDCMRMEATKFSPRQASRKHSIPSQDDLDKFTRKVADLQTLEMTRKKQYLSSREEILKYCQILCHDMQADADDFCRAVLGHDTAKFVLSTENLKALELLRKKFAQKVSNLAEQGRELRNKILALWEELSMTSDNHLEECSVYSKTDIIKLQEVYTALHQERLSRLGEVTEKIRKDLSQLHDQLSFGDNQRQQFKLLVSTDFTCEVLDAHRQEKIRLERELHSHATLYKLVLRREKMWKSKLQFESSSAELQRYNNRGGQLLKDQKMQKQIEKELPKIESEVASLVESWQAQSSVPFQALDEVYMQRVSRQWQELKTDQEEKKRKRKEQKLADIEEERIYGARAPPTTPLKQRNAMTPVATRSRSRIDTSSSCSSSVLASPRVVHSSLRTALPPPSPRIAAKTAVRMTSSNMSKILGNHQTAGHTPTHRVTRSMAIQNRAGAGSQRRAATQRQVSRLISAPSGTAKPSSLASKKRNALFPSASSASFASANTTLASASSIGTSASSTTTTTASAENTAPNMSISSVSYAAFKTGLALGPGGSEADTSHCCATSVARSTFV